MIKVKKNVDVFTSKELIYVHIEILFVKLTFNEVTPGLIKMIFFSHNINLIT